MLIAPTKEFAITAQACRLIFWFKLPALRICSTFTSVGVLWCTVVLRALLQVYHFFEYRSLCIMYHLSLTRSTYFHSIAQALAHVLRASTGPTVRCRCRWRRAFRVTKVSTQLNLHKLATQAPGLKGTRLLSRSESFYNRLFVSMMVLFTRRYEADNK